MPAKPQTQATPKSGGLSADDEALRVPITDLTPWPGNARRGNIDVIAESLGEHGQYVPLTVQRSTGYVLRGNHTLAALERRGRSHAAVVYVDVDEDEARRIVLVDNRSSDLAEYEVPALGLELTKLGGDYTGTGYDVYASDKIADAIAKMTPALPTGPQPPLRSDRTRVITCPNCSHEFDSTDAVEVRTPHNAGGRS